LTRRRASVFAVALCASLEAASRKNSQPSALALSVIFAGFWRAPETFRTAGVAATYVTLARLSTRIAQARPSLPAEPLASREPASREINFPNAFALSAIVAECWCAPKTLFRMATFFYRGSVRSHGRRGLGVRYSGTIINAHQVSQPPPSLPSLRLKETQACGLSCRCLDAAGNILCLLICRVFFSCCGGVASPQATACAPTWAPRASTCDAQRAAPRTTTSAPRSSSCDA
jgi:hypothetical protein